MLIFSKAARTELELMQPCLQWLSAGLQLLLMLAKLAAVAALLLHLIARGTENLTVSRTYCPPLLASV